MSKYTVINTDERGYRETVAETDDLEYARYIRDRTDPFPGASGADIYDQNGKLLRDNPDGTNNYRENLYE